MSCSYILWLVVLFTLCVAPSFSLATTDPCYADGKNGIIDVRKLAGQFSGKNITSHDGRHIYFLSLCSPIACSFRNPHSSNAAEAACQYDTVTDTFYSLGKIASYKWEVISQTYYSITFSGGDRVYSWKAETERHARVGFNIDSSEAPRIEITSVELSSSGTPTYVFNVHYDGNA